MEAKHEMNENKYETDELLTCSECEFRTLYPISLKNHTRSQVKR